MHIVIRGSTRATMHTVLCVRFHIHRHHLLIPDSGVSANPFDPLFPRPYLLNPATLHTYEVCGRTPGISTSTVSDSPISDCHIMARISDPIVQQVTTKPRDWLQLRSLLQSLTLHVATIDRAEAELSEEEGGTVNFTSLGGLGRLCRSGDIIL